MKKWVNELIMKLRFLPLFKWRVVNTDSVDSAEQYSKLSLIEGGFFFKRFSHLSFNYGGLRQIM